MLSPNAIKELETCWLPNITEAGLDRLCELLESSSPLLISGSFTKAIPMGCLASHIAWNHPQTGSQSLEAGINWLHQVAGLNPATSHVIREWDRRGNSDWEMRTELLQMLYREKRNRLTRSLGTACACNELAMA